MSHTLRRYHAHRERIEDERNIARIILETGGNAPPPRHAGATAGGDERKLRGIPAIARGVPGHIPGTRP